MSGQPAILTTVGTVSVAGMCLWASALWKVKVCLIPFPKAAGPFGHLHMQVRDSPTSNGLVLLVMLELAANCTSAPGQNLEPKP